MGKPNAERNSGLLFCPFWMTTRRNLRVETDVARDAVHEFGGQSQV